MHGVSAEQIESCLRFLDNASRNMDKRRKMGLRDIEEIIDEQDEEIESARMAKGEENE